MALWDIKGKALNQSVSSLLGGYRQRVPTYASGALMRPVNVERLAEIGPMLAEKGFRQMKTQMGAEPTAAREVARIRTLRNAVGDDIDLMCDINQLWGVNQAITIGRQVEEYHLYWLEMWWPTTTIRGWRKWPMRWIRPSPPASMFTASTLSASSSSIGRWTS